MSGVEGYRWRCCRFWLQVETTIQFVRHTYIYEYEYVYVQCIVDLTHEGAREKMILLMLFVFSGKSGFKFGVGTRYWVGGMAVWG